MGWALDWITGWAGFFALTFHADTLLLLCAGIGFAAVRVANHRSRGTSFRIDARDPFQWAELAFFTVLLARGLWRS